MSRFIEIEIDPAIIRGAARGEAKAHEVIYKAFAPPVYSICLRFTRVPAHAEDLLQDTFMEVIRSIGAFRGEAPLGAWIRRIAVSKALMFLRSAWHSRGQGFEDDGAELRDGRQNPARTDHALDLEAALATLPPVSRAVVWLHDVEGFTHGEIAAFMGKTESFSKSQLARAYRRLRPLLGGETGSPAAETALGGC